MNIVFRADASLDIGTGHVMRCLTLADALRERGASSRFICREHPGNLLEFIRQHGYETHALPMGPAGAAAVPGNHLPAHANWLGADWREDARQTQAILAGANVDWLVVDHYAMDADWERAIGSGSRLMAIDDLADRPHRCDLLLDQNLGHAATDYAELIPPEATVLAGPDYALLRPEFASLREYSLRRRAVPRLNHLLVTMGGIDKANATGQALVALKQCALGDDVRITVVMGQHAPWLESVRALADSMPWLTEVRVGVQEMAPLMADCDLALGAAGSTSWERCTLGVPTLMMIVAENQRAAGQALARTGAVRLIELGDLLEPALRQFFENLRGDVTVLEAMSKHAQGICDGRGTALVCERLLVQ